MATKRKRRQNTIHSRIVDGEIRYTNEAEDFSAAVDTFIDYCRVKNLSDFTIRYYLNVLKDFVKFALVVGVNRPADLTVENVEKMIQAKLDSGVKPTTVNTSLKGWRTFIRFLYEKGHIPKDIAADIKLLRTERRIIPAFTKTQIRQLLAAPDKSTFTGFRDYVLMLLLLETGVRISEVERIKITDINWSEKVIKIFGKGRKERYVPFQSTLARELKRYINARGVLDHDFLFINIDNEPLKRRTMQENIKRYGEIARIKSVRVSPHTFRHTFAKLYILNGGDPFSLQKILGHTTQEMVQTYVSMFGTDIAQQHRKFSPLERLNDNDE